MKTLHLHLLRAFGGASTIVLLAGCAGNRDIPELQSARTLVAEVQASPMRGLAAANVNAAQDALAKANTAAAEGDDLARVEHLAYLAKRNAQIASQKIQAAQADQAVEKAELERQRVLTQGRSLEAQRARERLEEARTAAQRANQEREVLQQQLARLEKTTAKRTSQGFVLTMDDEVLFGVDQASIKPGAMRTLDQLAQFLKQHEQRTVRIEGHTDSTGPSGYNVQLSRERADAVRAALILRGVAADRIQAVGRGEDFPVASNANAGGRQENRRVEIFLPDDGQQLSRDRRD